MVPDLTRSPPPSTSHHRIAAVAAGIALTGSVSAILGAVELARQATLLPGLVWLGFGAIVFALWTAASSHRAPLQWVQAWSLPHRPVPPVPARRRLMLRIAAGSSAALGAAALAVWLRDGFLPPAPFAGLALAAWLLAVGLALAGSLAGQSAQPVEPGRLGCTDPARVAVSASTRSVRNTGEIPGVDGAAEIAPLVWALLLVGLTIGALALRLWGVGGAPFGLWFDEAESGLEARRLLAGAPYEPLSRDFGRDASLFFYLVAGGFLTLGDSVFTLRAVSSLVGAAAVPLAALLGREWFGWRVGLAAAAFLALSRWELNLSRISMTTITAVPLALLGAWLLTRAIRRQGIADFALAGLALGLGVHGYIGWRPMLAPLTVLFLGGWLRQRWSLQAGAARVATYGGVALLVAIPIVAFAVRFPAEFNQRTAQTFVLTRKNTLEEQVSTLLESTRAHLLMFQFQGDRNGRHNLPGAPMLDPVAGALLASGTAWIVLRALMRDVRAWTLLAWAAAGLSGGILTLEFEAPQAVRTIVVVPALCLLAGLALVLAGDRLRLLLELLFAGHRWPRFREPARGSTHPRTWRKVPGSRSIATGLATAAMLSFVAWSGWRTIDVYFNRQMLDAAVWEAFSTPETIVGREAQAAADQRPTVLLSAVLASTPSIRYLAPETVARSGVRALDPALDLPLKRSESPTLLYLDARDQPLMQQARRLYPNAVPRRYTAPGRTDPVLTGITVSATEAAAARGVKATYQSPGGGSTVRQELQAGADWRSSPPPVPYPFSVEWRAWLAIAQSGTYRFIVPDGFSLEIDGLRLASGGERSVPLARGNHLVSLTGGVDRPREVSLLWTPVNGQILGPISPTVLFQGAPGGPGLLAKVFTNATWEGQPSQELVDPVVSHYFHLTPAPRPYSMEWSGRLRTDVAGEYRLGLEQSSAATLWVDNRLVLESTASRQYQEASVQLEAGVHEIRIRYQDLEGGGFIVLSWVPPGGVRAVVPGEALYPPPPLVP